MKRVDSGRSLVIAAGLLSAIGAFLPFYSFPDGATLIVWDRGLFPTAALIVLICGALAIEAVVEQFVHREVPSPFLNFSWEQCRLAGSAFCLALVLSYLVQGRANADLGAGYVLQALAAVVLFAGGVLTRREELRHAPTVLASELDEITMVATPPPDRPYIDDWLDDPKLRSLLTDDGEVAEHEVVDVATPPVEGGPVDVILAAPEPEPEAEPEPETQPEPERDPVAPIESAEEPVDTPEAKLLDTPEAKPVAPVPTEAESAPIALVVVPAADSTAGSATGATRSRRRGRSTAATRKAAKPSATGKRRTRAAASDRHDRDEPGQDADAEQRDPDPAQDDPGDGHSSAGGSST